MTLQKRVIEILRENDTEMTTRQIAALMPDAGFSSVSASISALAKMGILDVDKSNFKAGFKYSLAGNENKVEPPKNEPGGPEVKDQNEDQPKTNEPGKDDININVKVEVVFKWEG